MKIEDLYEAKFSVRYLVDNFMYDKIPLDVLARYKDEVETHFVISESGSKVLPRPDDVEWMSFEMEIPRDYEHNVDAGRKMHVKYYQMTGYITVDFHNEYACHFDHVPSKEELEEVWQSHSMNCVVAHDRENMDILNAKLVDSVEIFDKDHPNEPGFDLETYAVRLTEFEPSDIFLGFAMPGVFGPHTTMKVYHL